MRILIIGSGGREHALAWKISQSPLTKKIFCAPGNAGIASVAECVDIGSEDVENLAAFARSEKIDLTVVGPEDPLSMGIVDRFQSLGLRIFGPSGQAARLESSKAFARQVLGRYGIPGPAFQIVESVDAARACAEEMDGYCVVKADGLAKGKGVIVCGNVDEACDGIDLVMKDRAFGSAGDRVVIEERLDGEEVSILAFTDGEAIIMMESAQDHKRVGEGDTGKNTGGMGAYSPAPVLKPRISAQIEQEIILQTIHAMNAEGWPYRGVLYAGLMITDSGPKVLEFNVRFGDPETQPLMIRMKSDIVPLLMACTDGTLGRHEIEWDRRPSVCIVMASDGYPDEYKKGIEITGLEEADAVEDCKVFHAGTKLSKGKVVTAGGRVLGVTALGSNVMKAQQRCLEAVSRIHFNGAHYRRDIGFRAIRREMEA
ncbi:MAG TPA: phosphoribosylamine--glycine ligase [Candidatus Brocadiia bacterium]|nr:phosphoribosylamine--glycine ligase [Candidatus Brocadiia bacterium]